MCTVNFWNFEFENSNNRLLDLKIWKSKICILEPKIRYSFCGFFEFSNGPHLCHVTNYLCWGAGKTCLYGRLKQNFPPRELFIISWRFELGWTRYQWYRCGYHWYRGVNEISTVFVSRHNVDKKKKLKYPRHFLPADGRLSSRADDDTTHKQPNFDMSLNFKNGFNIILKQFKNFVSSIICDKSVKLN